MSIPITPERAEILSLRHSVSRALRGQAHACRLLAASRSKRRACDVALQNEHARAVKLEADLQVANTRVSMRGDDVERLVRERDAAREDEKALSLVLEGVALELDRLVLKAVPLTLEAVSRIRALIPTETP